MYIHTHTSISSFGQKRKKRWQILLVVIDKRNIIITESFLIFGWSGEKLER